MNDDKKVTDSAPVKGEDLSKTPDPAANIVDQTSQKSNTEVESQRPDKVYLKNCRIYSQKHMDKLKLKVESYRFKPEDFRDNLLSPVFFERLKTSHQVDFETHKLNFGDLGVLFKNDGTKIFVDYIFHTPKDENGEPMTNDLYMIVKSWQKVILRTPTSDAKKEKEGIRILEISKLKNRKNGLLQEELFSASNNYFFIKTLQVFDKFGKPVCEPILLEQVFGTFDSFRIYDGSFVHSNGKLYFFKRRFLTKEQEQRERSMFDQNNTQSVQSKSMKMSNGELTAQKRKDNQYQDQQSAYDNNQYQYGQDPEELYYANRSQIGAKKSKDKVYLQLYSLDLETCEQERISSVCIEEEDWDIQENELEMKNNKKPREKQSLGPMDPTRSQYHIQFSHEFGPQSMYESKVYYKDEADFLSSQFFSIQKYINGQEFHPFRIFRVGDYGDDKYRLLLNGTQYGSNLYAHMIVNTNSKKTKQVDNDKPSSQMNNLEINRQIQFLNHIRNFDGKPESIDFLVSNYFIMAGIKFNGTSCEQYIYQRKQLHSYQRIWNIGGIIPQKCVIKIDQEDETLNETQYFFTDSRNNIQLMIPNYESKLDQQRRVEQIRDTIDFSPKFYDYLEYKKICFLSINDDAAIQSRNVFQKFDDLTYILDKDIKCGQSFNFFQDSECQILYLSESKLPHVIIYKMKKEKSQNCTTIEEDYKIQEKQQNIQVDDYMKQKMQQLKKSSTTKNKENPILPIIKRALREEVCDIDNQTSQAIKGTRPKDLKRNRPNQACEICDNDHDEPFTQYVVQVTEQNVNLFRDINEAGPGFGIIRLSSEERRNYCMIDDFNGVKRKVKTFNFFESQQLRLLSYVISKDNQYCLFLFAVYNPDKNFDDLNNQDQTLIKRSYIFVRKGQAEMIKIYNSNGDQEILRNDDNVIILKRWNCFETIKFTDIKQYQFKDLYEKQQQQDDSMDEKLDDQYQSQYLEKVNTDFIELSLTLCKFEECDKQQMNFLPFVYQEKNNSNVNKLIVYDICNNEPTEFLAMSPPDMQKEYLYENENGYNKFMICRSSEVYEQQIGKGLISKQTMSKAKYQVFTLYSEKIGRLHCEEFIITHDQSTTRVDTIGQKDILFSNKIISNIEWDYIRLSEAYPYMNKDNVCKGCKIKLMMGPRNEGAFINLVDQEESNIYFYKSNIVLCGNMIMILKKEDPEMFVTVTATVLRKNIIQQQLFNRSQAYEVVGIGQELMMRMKIPDLEYLVLNSFDDIRKKDFFTTQEILQGKMIGDICLSSAESWIEALGQFRQEWKEIKGCTVEKVISGDRVRREHMQLCNFYPKLCIVQLDLNFMGTIERAFHLNSFKSLKGIFNHILDVIDTFEYQKFIMYELPIIIEQKQIQIDDFYNLSQAERKNAAKGFCNLEIELSQKELPPFSDEEFASFQIQKFQIFNQIENEIAQEIWKADKKKNDAGIKDADKKFETEYFYIDYHYMIIGDTIRKYRENQPIPVFNDLLYSRIISKKVGESQRNSFFLQETIQKIIDSQWKRTRYIQKQIFLIYVIFYCIPMGMSCFQLMDSLMFNIAIWPAFILLLIELVQMYEQKMKYLTSGWNLIDSGQLVVFGILYYMRYMGEDRNVLYFPELKLVNIILTFLKLLFFVRIFEAYGFLVQMIILCLQDLVPFFICYLLFLNFFTMCFIVLQCDIDGEIADVPILNRYTLMLLQVYRTALGELSMPGYKVNAIWKNGDTEGDFFLQINILMIWIMWCLSTFFMFVIMTNFNIAQITSTYERVRGLEKKISFELKAEMNYETYMLLSTLNQRSLSAYRCIIFANTKNSQGGNTELLDEQFDSLKKCIVKNNQKFDDMNEQHMHKVKKVCDAQVTLRHFFKDKMNELIKRQDTMRETLIKDIKSRFELQ